MNEEPTDRQPNRCPWIEAMKTIGGKIAAEEAGTRQQGERWKRFSRGRGTQNSSQPRAVGGLDREG